MPRLCVRDPYKIPTLVIRWLFPLILVLLFCMIWVPHVRYLTETAYGGNNFWYMLGYVITSTHLYKASLLPLLCTSFVVIYICAHVWETKEERYRIMQGTGTLEDLNKIVDARRENGMWGPFLFLSHAFREAWEKEVTRLYVKETGQG